jgi:hypothetical protein
MKKSLVLALLLGLVFCIFNQVSTAQEEEPAQAEPKLVYTFKSDDEMAEFERMYVTKQIIANRINVLASYLAQEQNNLEQIDGQMYVRFKFTMDPAKRYDLNRETRELRELPPTTPTAPTMAE